MLFKICAVALQVLSHNLYTVLCIPHDPAALEDHFRDDDDGPVSSQGYMPYLNKYILDKVHSLSYSLTGGIVFGDRLYISSSVWQCVFVHVYLLVSITQTGQKILFLSLCSNIYHEHSWLSCLCLLCVRWWKARLSKKMWMSSAGLLLPRRTIDQKESAFYLEKTPSGSGVCSYFSRRTDILWSLSLMRWDSCIVSFRYIFKKH